jgi:thiosulfate dehydrogenase
MTRLCSLLLLASLLGACGDRDVPAAEFGRDRFSDRTVSTSRFNTFTCATCHVVDPAAPAVVPGGLDSGYNLAGAPTRGGWWGGGSPSLLDAINVCIAEFMGGRPLERDSETARQLDAYLESTPPVAEPAKFSFVRTATALREVPGDATRGKDAYQNACFRCHGEAFTRKGASIRESVVLPQSTMSTFGELAREVTVEKIRHGRFINIGGVMPFYTTEAMADQTVADILTFLKL